MAEQIRPVPPIPQGLREAAQIGVLIPFVGAGASRLAGCPGWGDFAAGALRWLIEHDELEGPVNLAAPNPLPNSEFMRVLRSAWGMPFGLPATEWMLELGAFVLQSETELILKSRRVIPTRLLQSGFTFRFPAWPNAARELCKRASGNGHLA